MNVKKSLGALFLLGLALIAGARALPENRAEAIAPCVEHANTAEEMQFMQLLQSWRDSQGLSAGHQLQLSGPLNRAAAGFAQYLLTTSPEGHDVDGSTPWDRAKNCGFVSRASDGATAGGEGLAVEKAQTPVAMGPQAALSYMAAHDGTNGTTRSGIYYPSSSFFPVKCAGVAKAVAPGGTKIVWVVLVFVKMDGACPEPVTGPATATPPPPTITPSPSPSPTPPPPYGVTIEEGWNLVTLPSGPIAEVMLPFAGCYVSIYSWQPGTEQWLRYAPSAPAYVNTLTVSNGQGVWVHGIDRCSG